MMQMLYPGSGQLLLWETNQHKLIIWIPLKLLVLDQIKHSRAYYAILQATLKIFVHLKTII